MHYFLVYKPFGTISQFSPEGGHSTLADLGFLFPKDCYPVGRLDTDSEGLLLITNDKTLNQRLLDPDLKFPKTYWVQVEGLITDEAITALENGVSFTAKGKIYVSAQAKVGRIFPQHLPQRNPPVRFRKNVPDCWIAITITEGKNRQVRKMTAATGFPTLRLIRRAIGGLTTEGLQPGQVLEIDYDVIRKQLLMKQD